MYVTRGLREVGPWRERDGEGNKAERKQIYTLIA